MNSWFMVYTDNYSRRFPGEGRQTIVGLSTTAIFSFFAGYIFGNFRDEARVII